ncbi:ribosomal protein S18-alanine N-acetyltransferase [Cyanothece sp. BG0011]|uniref:ribosomal protein S18-alanine N-acetyltransferase n=1 Tax=Cyanothece sp. BG0011 TaxID=2082950 RepID=UPI000D1EA415|nr:ribosomal protein S18-alanine N-acetyltransferase [Cyanothece sp. BG0011]
MSSFVIQLQTPQLCHLDELVTLDQDCLGGLWTKEGYQRELKSPNSHFWVLSSDTTETLIGGGCYWEILEEAHITLLMIAPQYQGQGLGQLLLYGLLRDAMRRNLERATLEVRVSNQPALSLYRKFGFEIAGRRTGYYKQTGEDALVLWRSGLDYPQFQQELSTWEQQIKDRLSHNHWQFSIVEP